MLVNRSLLMNIELTVRSNKAKNAKNDVKPQHNNNLL